MNRHSNDDADRFRIRPGAPKNRGDAFVSKVLRQASKAANANVVQWACSNSTGEDYAKNMVVTAALLAVFLIIALVVYFTGFKPLPADPQPAAAAPPADREVRTEQQPVVRVDDRRPQA